MVHYLFGHCQNSFWPLPHCQTDAWGIPVPHPKLNLLWQNILAFVLVEQCTHQSGKEMVRNILRAAEHRWEAVETGGMRWLRWSACVTRPSRVSLFNFFFGKLVECWFQTCSSPAENTTETAKASTRLWNADSLAAWVNGWNIEYINHPYFIVHYTFVFSNW